MKLLQEYLGGCHASCENGSQEDAPAQFFGLRITPGCARVARFTRGYILSPLRGLLPGYQDMTPWQRVALT